MTMFALDDAIVTAAVAAVTPPHAEAMGAGSEESDGAQATHGQNGAAADAEPGRAADGVGGRTAQVDDSPPEGVESGRAGGAAGVQERFARATWSGIAEPGDVVAGVLVRSLGASEALMSLVERRRPAQILSALRQRGGDEVPMGELELAVQRWMPRLTANSALNSLRLAERCGAQLVIPGDDDWPELLHDLGPHEPLALWVRGSRRAVGGLAKSIAMVGARAATGYGEHMAMELAAGLSDSGWAVVSGAAYGIDGMAHRTTLASGGRTVAFLAGGVDRFYPSGHDTLLTRIVNEGAVVSEMPCGSPPTKWRFLQRNRLIAASSRATVVVEAGRRSGSLNTAAHAASLGRPLGAVPGPVTSLSSAGCHRLLRDFGATCVTTPAEVIELAGGPTAAEAESPRGRREFASAEQMRVLDALSNRVYRSVDEVARRSGLAMSATQSLLGALALEGVITEGERGWRVARPAHLRSQVIAW